MGLRRPRIWPPSSPYYDRMLHVFTSAPAVWWCAQTSHGRCAQAGPPGTKILRHVMVKGEFNPLSTMAHHLHDSLNIPHSIPPPSLSRFSVLRSRGALRPPPPDNPRAVCSGPQSLLHPIHLAMVCLAIHCTGLTGDGYCAHGPGAPSPSIARSSVCLPRLASLVASSFRLESVSGTLGRQMTDKAVKST